MPQTLRDSAAACVTSPHAQLGTKIVALASGRHLPGSARSDAASAGSLDTAHRTSSTVVQHHLLAMRLRRSGGPSTARHDAASGATAIHTPSPRSSASDDLCLSPTTEALAMARAQAVTRIDSSVFSPAATAVVTASPASPVRLPASSPAAGPLYASSVQAMASFYARRACSSGSPLPWGASDDDWLPPHALDTAVLSPHRCHARAGCRCAAVVLPCSAAGADATGSRDYDSEDGW